MIVCTLHYSDIQIVTLRDTIQNSEREREKEFATFFTLLSVRVLIWNGNFLTFETPCS